MHILYFSMKCCIIIYHNYEKNINSNTQISHKLHMESNLTNPLVTNRTFFNPSLVSSLFKILPHPSCPLLINYYTIHKYRSSYYYS